MLDGSTAFLDRIYDETMGLLVEARNYVSYHEAMDSSGLAPCVQLQISYECMRVTSRLTQVMAWLLAQRAVNAGEMTAARASSDEFALSGGNVCTDPSGPENEELPAGLRSLLQRSHSLYMRVERLCGLVRQNAA